MLVLEVLEKSETKVEDEILGEPSAFKSSSTRMPVLNYTCCNEVFKS